MVCSDFDDCSRYFTESFYGEFNTGFLKDAYKDNFSDPHSALSLESWYMEWSFSFLMDDYFSIFLSDFRAKHRTDKADRYTLVKEKKKSDDD